MKLELHKRRESGIAVLVMFILMSLMTALVISNSICLHYLKRDILLIEKRQLSKFELYGLTSTNAAMLPSHAPTNRVAFEVMIDVGLDLEETQ